MKKIIILLLIGSVAMGIHDGGDITVAVLLAFLTAPILFEKKEKRKRGRRMRRKERM